MRGLKSDRQQKCGRGVQGVETVELAVLEGLPLGNGLGRQVFEQVRFCIGTHSFTLSDDC